MEKITKEIFDRLNKGTCNEYEKDSSLGYQTRLYFSGKQIIEFLEKNGYIVGLHTVLGTISVYRGEHSTRLDVATPIERIIAVKDLNELPEKWEYDSCNRFIFDGYLTVFEKLLKEKLLKL